MSEMGDRIRSLRKKAGMTQDELGEKLGVKKAAVNKYETGDVENIPRQSIEAMCKLFDVSAGYLLGIDDSHAKEFELIQEKYGKGAVKLLHSFSQLNEAEKQKVISYCEDIHLIHIISSRL